jgi:hypothetical protein
VPDPARHLRLIDPATGELVNECPQCLELQDQLEGAQREIRSWRSAYANLKRDKEKEAREHPSWPDAVKLFGEWQQQCNHPRAKWSADRFFVVEPFLRQDGFEMCLRAIAGAAFDPWRSKQPRRNGTHERFDDFGTIFKSRKTFEAMCNRAPRGWAPPSDA